MTAGMHVIAESIPDEMAGLRELVGSRTFLSEEFEDRAGGDGGEEFALGVGPSVGVTGLEQDRPRSHQRDQAMRV
jgi:hypothetical protein